MTSTRKLSMADIRSAAKLAGSHWFDRSSMRFFNTVLCRSVYQGHGGVYFVSSEQFVGSNGVKAPRKYAVRRVALDPFDIRTVGDFNDITTLDEAREIARSLAKGD